MMKNNLQHVPVIPMLVGTGFGAGFWPWGPGTAGAVVATLIWWGLHFMLSWQVLTIVTAVLIVLCTLFGIWATARLMPYWGDDPSRVVIDEMVGVWMALLVAHDGWTALLALVLFRFFDIVKPLGIRRLDQRKGAFWVMADDLLAGFYSGFVLYLIIWLAL